MDKREIARVLRRAEQVIGERGWCQGNRVDQEGRVCARGAIEIAVYGAPMGPATSDRDYHLIEAAVDALYGYLGELVEHWNDKDGRQAVQVRHTLLAVARRLDEQAVTP